MKTLSPDTLSEVERIMIEGYRKMPALFNEVLADTGINQSFPAR
jgi:hypothetical protein